MVWRFEPGEQLGDAFRRVATEEIAKIRAGLGDDEKPRARAIHEARQGFKRLRALLRLAQPSLGAAFQDENQRWREAGRRLSGSRDATVLLESLDKIVHGCDGGVPPDEVERLRVHLAADGPRADGSDTDQQVSTVLALLEEADARVPILHWPDDKKALAKGLKRTQARLRKNWKAARKSADPHALHDWRKRVKDQAAHLRLFRHLLPSGLRGRHSAEKKTAELLGEEHDFWMLAERLSSGNVPAATAATCVTLLSEINARREGLRDQALRLGEDFSSQRPKMFARQMIAAWEKPARRGEKAAAATSATSQAS